MAEQEREDVDGLNIYSQRLMGLFLKGRPLILFPRTNEDHLRITNYIGYTNTVIPEGVCRVGEDWLPNLSIAVVGI